MEFEFALLRYHFLNDSGFNFSRLGDSSLVLRAGISKYRGCWDRFSSAKTLMLVKNKKKKNKEVLNCCNGNIHHYTLTLSKLEYLRDELDNKKSIDKFLYLI